MTATYWANDPAYHRASRRAVTFSVQGELKLWVSCFACAQVVGRYEAGATIALAQELHRSVDTVESRARAAVAYRLLFAHFRTSPEVQARLRTIRRLLGYSHFAEAGRWLRNDMSPLDVFAQLDTAAREGAGARKMSQDTNGHTMLDLPVWTVDSKTFYDFVDRNGKKAKVVILPDDYEGETVKVSV